MVSTMPSLFILIVTITYTFLVNRSAHLLPHTPVWPGQCIHTSGNFVCLIPTVKYGHFELYATDWEPVTRLLWWCQCGTSQPIVITTTSILMLDVVDIKVLLRSASLPRFWLTNPTWSVSIFMLDVVDIKSPLCSVTRLPQFWLRNPLPPQKNSHCLCDASLMHLGY